MNIELKPQTKTEKDENTYRLVGPFKYFFLLGGLIFFVAAITPLVLEKISTTMIMVSIGLSAFGLLSFATAFWRYRLTSDFLYIDGWYYKKRLRLLDIDAAAMVGDLLVLKMRGGKQEKLFMTEREFQSLARILLDKYGGNAENAQKLHKDLLSAQKNNRISHAIQIGFWIVVIAILYCLNHS